MIWLSKLLLILVNSYRQQLYTSEKKKIKYNMKRLECEKKQTYSKRELTQVELPIFFTAFTLENKLQLPID